MVYAQLASGQIISTTEDITADQYRQRLVAAGLNVTMTTNAPIVSSQPSASLDLVDSSRTQIPGSLQPINNQPSAAILFAPAPGYQGTPSSSAVQANNGVAAAADASKPNWIMWGVFALGLYLYFGE